jgi:energy-coupling factor transport system substrate-specific component
MSGIAVVLGGLLALVLASSWALRGLDSANRVAVVVLLSAFATAFNLVVPMPNVEATTTVVVCTALTLGLRPAIAVGILAVLGTSITGGLGLWTGWQVLGMSLVASLAATFGPAARDVVAGAGRVRLGCLVALATVAYELVVTMPTVQLAGAGRSAGGFLEGMVALVLLGLPFTIVHVIATVALTLVAGPALVAALERSRNRLAPVPT